VQSGMIALGIFATSTFVLSEVNSWRWR